MKRYGTFLLCVLLSLSLSACAGKKSGQMYIEEAHLTEEENKIATLLGNDQKHHLYDFRTDDTVKSIQINTYELLDGEWHMVTGGGGLAFEDAEGRLGLSFDKLADGLRVALQSKHTNDTTSYVKENEPDVTGMACVTSFLSGQTEVVYEQEIPLVIQIITSKDEVHSYDVDYYFRPEEYAKYDYESVYAVTILFSQKTLG